MSVQRPSPGTESKRDELEVSVLAVFLFSYPPFHARRWNRRAVPGNRLAILLFWNQHFGKVVGVLLNFAYCLQTITAPVLVLYLSPFRFWIKSSASCSLAPELEEATSS